LYDQFSYGVMRHPISIRNFANKLRKIENLPEYFYLIGKGREYQTYRKLADISNSNDLPLLVPTFGYPGSDRMLLSDNSTATPLTAIGRLPASTTEDIRIYLNKVKEYEDNINNPSTIEDRAWMKRVIHLGGGGAAEQNTIRNHLVSLEDIIENNAYGANVNSFYRSNTNAVEVSTNDQIFELLNDGSGIVTFFGHGAASGFDFSIDNFDNFDNQGKYPVMFALGCSIGNIHTPFNAVGERFVFGNEDKGMIAFISSTSFGFVSVLRTQMGKTYDLLGGSMYGESIGNIMRATTSNYDTQNNILTQQNTLNGDPALRYNPFEGPDIVVDPASVKFNPVNVTTELDSFQFSFDLINIGKGVEDSLTLKIEQRFPNGQLVNPITARVKAPPFKQNLTYQIPIYGKESVGLNKMLVTIDANDEIEELPSPAGEMNNRLESSLGNEGISFFIQDNGIQAIYPPEFAIVNDAATTLVASTANALASERKYIMEIDVTEDFNSPALQGHTNTQKGGLFKWQPNLNWQDEQVYYWRVSQDSLSPAQPYVWSESNFVYSEVYEEGWNQSDFGQLVQNDLGEMKYDKLSEELEFGNVFLHTRVKNKVYTSSVDRPDYFVNGGNWFGMWIWEVSQVQSGVQVIVITPNVDAYWINPNPGDHGSINNSSALPCYSFKTETIEDRENVINFLENVVPDDYYVTFYTSQNGYDNDYYNGEWAMDSVTLGKNIFSVLEEQGAQKIRNIETDGSVPYGIIYRKGSGVIDEDVADNKEGTAAVENYFVQFLQEGKFSSKVFGPAVEWKNLYWEATKDDMENDTVYLSVHGLTNLNSTEEVELLARVEGDTTVNFIDANLYPYLKLRYHAKDLVNRSPAQIDYWRLTYKGTTELAVNPAAEFEFYQDTLQEGEIFKIKYAIENISQHNADSLLIKYSVTDEQNEVVTKFDRIAPLNKFGQTTTEFIMETRGLQNIQNVLVEINPIDDQTEQTHINNFINSAFFVERDKRNPLLDVTFDGVHIMDGDLISPEPIIVINLTDENEFLALGDTSMFKLSLQYPDETETRNISFAVESIAFFPAILNEQGDKNEAKIEFTPSLTIDGTYTLIVEARDATGNESGDLQYKIRFEVINKNMISNILNYPNPFSTSTRFVYTLTGNEPPAFFKIQIMTVSGRIVREITQDEIGPMRTGTHTTDYAWDGTDEYGDRLANGIYLYRVTAQRSDGSAFEKIETGADKFVQKGFGKMVLVR
jgi:hypothetical protein